MSTNPTDQWLRMYHQNNLSSQPTFHLSDHHGDASSLVSDATVVTAAVSSSTAPATGSSLSPDGRVGKPVRRRSRASRRTPTTLLNTDAANFRAMVQQFTGGPNSHSNVPNFTFGYGGSQPVYDPPAAMLPQTGYHLPTPQQQQQQQQTFQYQTQQTPFMFSLNDTPSRGIPASEAFVQTHGGSRAVNYMGLFDGSSPTHPRPS